MTTPQIKAIWARILTGAETAWETEDVYLALQVREFTASIERQRV